MIAGKVLNLDGSQHRFAFARNGNSASEFANAVASAASVSARPRRCLAMATPVYRTYSVRSCRGHSGPRLVSHRHAFRARLAGDRGLGAGTSSDYLRSHPIREIESAKWRLWHGRSSACLGRLARLTHWFDAAHVRRRKRRRRSSTTRQRSDRISLRQSAFARELRTATPRSTSRFQPLLSKARSTKSCQNV